MCSSFNYSCQQQLQCSLLNNIIQSYFYTFSVVLEHLWKQLNMVFSVHILASHIESYDCLTSYTLSSYILTAFHVSSCISFFFFPYYIEVTSLMRIVYWCPEHPNAVQFPSLPFCCHGANILRLSWYCFISLHGNNNLLTAIIHKISLFHSWFRVG